MKTKKNISLIFSLLVGFSVYSQTSNEYQKKIDSLESIKSSITLQLNELNKQINILKEQKSEVWANEQVGQIYVFIRDGDIYDIEREYQSVGKVKKGKRVIFIKDVHDYGMIVFIDGERYYVKRRWLKPLAEIEKKEMEQEIADSIAVMNATPMFFSFADSVYKLPNDIKPIMRMERGTEVLYVKDVEAKGLSYSLIIYKGEEYYISKYALITEGDLQRRAEQNKKIKEGNTKYKQSLINKYGDRNANRILEHKIWLGMTDEMAVKSWGNPDDINRTVSTYGVKEQWIYGDISNRRYLYFENGILTTWQD